MPELIVLAIAAACGLLRLGGATNPAQGDWTERDFDAVLRRHMR